MLLIQARDEAKQARAYLNENIEQKAALACDHLRSALEHLGHVTGRTTTTSYSIIFSPVFVLGSRLFRFD